MGNDESRDGPGDDGRTDAQRAAHEVESLTLDAVFYILSNRRRRYACRYLSGEADGVADFDAVVDHVVAWEAEQDDELPDDHRKRVVSDLHHAHLPQLSDANLLDYDPRSGTVRYWGHPQIEKWVERASRVEFSED